MRKTKLQRLVKGLTRRGWKLSTYRKYVGRYWHRDLPGGRCVRIGVSVGGRLRVIEIS